MTTAPIVDIQAQLLAARRWAESLEPIPELALWLGEIDKAVKGGDHYAKALARRERSR